MVCPRACAKGSEVADLFSRVRDDRAHGDLITDSEKPPPLQEGDGLACDLIDWLIASFILVENRHTIRWVTLA